jgi:AGZA family xanthine/uracil permease-like MFS transporter
LFKLKEHNTSPAIELNAGLTTFLSMVYVLAVNPAILSGAGMPQGALFTATALATALATLLMALYANLPFAVAPGMGLNAFFVVVATTMGYTWNQALTGILISGIVFVILSLSPAREKILREVPKCLQYGVSAGVGLMIAYIGLFNSQLVIFQPFSPSLGDISSGPGQLCAIGLLVTGLYLALGFRYALLASIVTTTLIGIPLGVTDTSGLSQGILSPPPSSGPIFFKFDFSVLANANFWGIVLALVFMEIVDGLAGFLGLFGAMGADGDRYRPKMSRAFVADSIGVVIGSLLGLSPNTTYCESGAGVAVGGRTGLTALTVAFLFLLALFLYPLFKIVPFSAVAPALVMVGLLMLGTARKIKFEDLTESFPAFCVIALITLTWRISDGLALGWLIYMVMKIFSRRYRELTPTVWAVGILFILWIIL